MPGGIRPISFRTLRRVISAGVTVWSLAAPSVHADMPAQLLGYAQLEALRATVASALSERDAAAFMTSLRPSLDLWKDRGVVPPLQNSRPPFAPTGDLGALLSHLVDTATPYLRSGASGQVERLLIALNTARCLKGWSITREYIGLLDVSLSLRASEEQQWEIHASLAPPQTPAGLANPPSFKGLSLAFPTGVSGPSTGRAGR